MDIIKNLGINNIDNFKKQDEKKLRFLLGLSDMIRSLSDPAKIHETVTRAAMDYFNADRCYYSEIYGNKLIIRQDASGGNLEFVAGTYETSDFLIFKFLVEIRAPIIITDVYTANLLDEELRRLFVEKDIISYISIPVIKDDKLVGVFCITQCNPRCWTADEVEIATEIAERTWMAVERAKEEKEKELLLAQAIREREKLRAIIDREESLKESKRHALDLVKKLRESDRQKNKFLSVLSHELRNPLATIMMGLSLLDQVSLDKEQEQKTRETITRQAEQLLSLVDDLLDITRITQNRFELKKEIVEFNKIIECISLDKQLMFDEKEIIFETEIKSNKIYVEGDPLRLTQVIENLLHNALKFTPKGGKVVLILDKDQKTREAVITVIDTGEGIPPELLEKVFESFVQVDHGVGKNIRGLGTGQIGRASCRERV